MEETANNNVNSEGKGLFKVATWIAAIILISKIAGFLRDVTVANYYGAGLVSDAYFYAYQIPALVLIILGGVGGPFHSATVAVFSKIVTDFKSKPPAEVKKLFNTFETITFIVFAALALLCFLFPKQIMGIIISGNSPELLELAARQLKIMSPVVLIGSIIGIYYGILVTHKHFLLPNLAPSFMSLGLIVTLLLSGGNDNGFIPGFYLAVGTTLGALTQLLTQIPTVYKMGFSFMPTFKAFKDANFKEILEILFPAFLSSTIGQVGLYIDMFFSSSLQSGAWTALGFANRIFQFAIGMLLTAILVPLFPLFTRLVAQKDMNSLKYYFKNGVGMLFFIGSYSMVFMMTVRTDAIRITLERGAFTSDATLLVSEILFFITISILPYVFRDSVTRLFYAFGDSKTPFYIATLSIIFKIILNMILVKPLGINGIALSTSIITLINGLLLGILIKKKFDFKYTPMLIELGKILLAAGVAGALGWLTHKVYGHFIPWNFIAGFIKIALIGFVSLGAYLLTAHLLKVVYVGVCVGKIKDKLLKRGQE